jgi:hypothetical protein
MCECCFAAIVNGYIVGFDLRMLYMIVRLDSINQIELNSQAVESSKSMLSDCKIAIQYSHIQVCCC